MAFFDAKAPLWITSSSHVKRQILTNQLSPIPSLTVDHNSATIWEELKRLIG
jgi:hypothetical protein